MIPGSPRWNEAIIGDTTASMKKGTPPIRTRPDDPDLKLRMISAALRDEDRIDLPCWPSCSPSGVGCIGRRPDTKSGSPMRFSRMEMVRDTADCVMPSMAAASVTPPVSMTAASWTRCASTIFIAICYSLHE
jgi:hypothetical protein